MWSRPAYFFFIYEWTRSQPMKEDDTYVTSSLTGWDPAQPWIETGPGPWFSIKMSSHQFRKSHCGDKTIVRSSYPHNGISNTSKMASLYWISPQIRINHSMSYGLAIWQGIYCVPLDWANERQGTHLKQYPKLLTAFDKNINIFKHICNI